MEAAIFNGALRDREESPRIAPGKDGTEVYTNPRGDQALEAAFDNLDQRLAEMDRYGINTADLSVQSEFTWIERLPTEESLPLVRRYNDGLAALCIA